MRIFLGVLAVLLNLADNATTFLCLRVPVPGFEVTEANPAAAWLFAAIGLEELSFRRYPRFRDIVRLLGVAVIENVGYRQLSTYWRIRGMVSKLRGAHGWGAMERRGFTP